MYFFVSVFVIGKQQLALSFEIVVRCDAVDIILQGSQNFGLVYADMLFELFHLVFVEGLD